MSSITASPLPAVAPAHVEAPATAPPTPPTPPAAQPAPASPDDLYAAAEAALAHGDRTAAELINFICFHLDVPPIEKQTLLEARGGRAGCLIDVLTFKLEERKLGPAGSPGSSGPVQ